MPYIVTPFDHVKNSNLTFDDILSGLSETKQRTYEIELKDTFDTRTVFRENLPDNLINKYPIYQMVSSLCDFNKKYSSLINNENKSELYHSFKIPKSSGGFRTINAPNDELKSALYELKRTIEKFNLATYHTSAFAYIKGRSTLDAVRRHQKNGSRWFLKLDFHDFFGSTTIDFVMNQLKLIFPFSEVVKFKNQSVRTSLDWNTTYENVDGELELKKALSLCFLNGGLPQGTPISPLITNIMMIPIDHAIAKLSRENTPHLCYTRYADDIILSSDLSFKWTDVQDKILEIIKDFNAPFTLNTKKTRYGSSAGRNWNLGVMLNKDNEITIGYKKKKVFKAMLFSLIKDYKEKIIWSVQDAQGLNGLISYYSMVEKDNIEKIIKDYSEKFNINIENLLKDTIKGKAVFDSYRIK